LAETVQGCTALLTLDEIADCLAIMAHSFIAYIDEAGDDGLNREKYRIPGRGGGSSHWLTIGATVWRLSRDLDAVRWAKEIRAKLPEQKQRKPLHFKDMDHAQRVMAVAGLVCSSKSSSSELSAPQYPSWSNPHRFFSTL
jgi:hypothetical protein